MSHPTPKYRQNAEGFWSLAKIGIYAGKGWTVGSLVKCVICIFITQIDEGIDWNYYSFTVSFMGGVIYLFFKVNLTFFVLPMYSPSWEITEKVSN